MNRSTDSTYCRPRMSWIFCVRGLKLVAHSLCRCTNFESFIQTVDLFSAASRTAIERPELAGGMTTLDGVLAPTLGAFYLATTLLFPFVAIRALGHEKQTGALKLAMQLPVSETAPDDSRSRKMETNVLVKLRRIMPSVHVRYEKVPKWGPFGVPEDNRYGLVTYEYQGLREASRSNSFSEILPILHKLARVTVTPTDTPAFAGHPLVVESTPAAWWCYAMLSAIVLGCWFLSGRLSRSSKPF